MRLIDGKQTAAKMCATLKACASDFNAKYGRMPGLTVVIVGEDPASKIYVGMKDKRANEIGYNSNKIILSHDTSEEVLLQKIENLNLDDAVDGILVQLPLPKHINAGNILLAISPSKDVDGFHPENVGRLTLGTADLLPCTPKGCMILLTNLIPDMRGLKAVIIGRSNIVGKPMALMLLEKGCTVTVTHSATRDLEFELKTADIVVAAAGVPELVKGSWIKKGAIVIDVGISRVETSNGSKIVGDVEFNELAHAFAATPVPGGVGPMTIACLMENTLIAALARVQS